MVGHDSGGMIARHAVAGYPRVRALGLIDTEQSTGLSWKFKSFIATRRIPGFGAALGFVAGRPRLRRNPLVFGDAFTDRSLLDGEFDEFFLQPLHRSRVHREAATRVLRSFDYRHLRDLRALHQRIDVPVQLVWGANDRFFPVKWAEAMVASFPDARIHVIKDAGLSRTRSGPKKPPTPCFPSSRQPAEPRRGEPT